MTMTKFKSAILLLAALILFCSCKFEDKTAERDLSYKEKRKYNIVVSSNISESGIKAMDEFCSKAEQLSNGDLMLSYKVSQNAIEDFYDGADFIFASNGDISRVNGDFLSYTSPFYFKNAEQALLALNSQKFIEQTSNITQSLLNAKQIGCYYGCSYIFLSSKVNTLFTFNYENNHVNLFEDLRIYGSFDYNDEFLLSQLGINAVFSNNNDAIEKFNSSYSHTVMTKKDEIDKITLPKGREKLFYYEDVYKIDFNWLFISESLSQKISNEYCDVIKEAAAYSMGLNDNLIFKKEENAIQNLQSQSIEIINVPYDKIYLFVQDIYENNIKFKRTWDINNHKMVRSIVEA